MVWLFLKKKLQTYSDMIDAIHSFDSCGRKVIKRVLSSLS